MLCIDGSKSAHSAYEEMMNFVRPDDEVFVMGVHEDYVGYVAASLPSLAIVNEEERVELKSFLLTYGKYLSEQGITHRCLLGKGNVGSVICKEAAHHKIDVIFIGRRNLSHMERSFSITDSHSAFVTQNAPCAVLVVKSHHDERIEHEQGPTEDIKL